MNFRLGRRLPAGIIVAIFLMRPLDKIGPMANVVTALVAIAAMITLGTPGLPTWLIMTSAICAHAFCSATHSSLNGTVGLFYPTRIRSNGVGWASGLGRIASIIGPVIVGYLMSAKLPLHDLLYFLAMPYFILVLTCIALGRLYVRSYRHPAPGPTAQAGRPCRRRNNVEQYLRRKEKAGHKPGFFIRRIRSEKVRPSRAPLRAAGPC